MIKLTCSIFIVSSNFFTLHSLNFFTYQKMSKDSLSKYYQNNKERFQKKLVKYVKIFLRKKKKKRHNMVAKDTKIYLKMKDKSLLSIEKKIIKWEKAHYYNYKKLLTQNFLFRKQFWSYEFTSKSLFKQKFWKYTEK